jgi:hypothetical protein
MTEEDARLSLLATELNTVQTAIRALDTIDFQIKGWSVTASLAIGGFAIAYHRPALIIVGIGALIGFFLLNCQYKYIQRNFINRNYEIDSALKSIGLMPFLNGAGTVQVLGTAAPDWKIPKGAKLRFERWTYSGILREARLPITYSLYLFILVCLIAEAIILA